MKRLLLATALSLLALPLLAAELIENKAPPPPEVVMEVPAELRAAFRKDVLDATAFPEARLERLVKFVFDAQGLGVTYRSDATQTVAEAYRSRTVNCLTSTMLFITLAREAGLKAHGQRVNSIRSWAAAEGLAIQTQHVNAIIEVAKNRRFVVDVDASDVLATGRLTPVDDRVLLAYFYGNHAMELLLDGQLADASRWMAAALQQVPDDASLLNDAGVLSLRKGDPQAAEALFLRAIKSDPGQIGAFSNLVSLYQGRGDQKHAKHWQERSDKLLRKAPYYQFQLGQQRERAGDLDGAISYYRRAVRLNRDEHRFHFALARLYFNAGRLGKADRELSMAFKLSEGAAHQRYQDKLAALRRMHR